MKNMILFSILFMSAQSWGSANAIFSANNDMVVIVVQGQGEDQDAVKLFDLLNSDAITNGNFLEKMAEFKESSGVKSVEVKCRISISVKNLGSCTIVLNKTNNSNFRQDIRYASYVLVDKAEAERLTKLFKLPSGTKDLFESGDKNFKIPYYDPQGLGDFGMVYAEIH